MQLENAPKLTNARIVSALQIRMRRIELEMRTIEAQWDWHDRYFYKAHCDRLDEWLHFKRHMERQQAIQTRGATVDREIAAYTRQARRAA
jgi:hypothetical protein